MTVYRIVDSPWPEREGLLCRIVERPTGPAGNVYPWSGKARNEEVIRIDDDPWALRDGWSCVISRRCLVPIADSGGVS